MSIFQIIKIIFVFLYDNFIGPEVGLKEAIQKHTNALVLLIMLLVSVFIIYAQNQQIATVRKIAKQNKERYIELKADRDALRKNYINTLISYDLMYRMHYDENDNLIIHDEETGANEGILHNPTHNKYFHKPPTLDEIVHYMNDEKASLSIIEKVHEGVGKHDEVMKTLTSSEVQAASVPAVTTTKNQ